MASPSAEPILDTLRQFVGAQATRELGDAQLLQRYVTRRDHEAFAALARRHGPLVWRTCRHLLRHHQDAEDAFQAVFVVLARRAASVREGEAVASWLYGVAYRVAAHARRKAARRKECERRAAATESREGDLGWRELQALLDEEVRRLPERCRTPFVLCCLEGRGRKEAAAELGLNEGTVSSRIAEARRLLRDRLARRGVLLSAALTAGELWRQSAHAIPPAVLMARAIASGTGESMIPEAVAALASATALGTARTYLLAAALAAFLAVTAAVVTVAEPTAAKPDAPTTAVAAPAVDAAGDPLPPDALARLGTLRFRHGGWIQGLAFMPDGKRLVSHGWTGIRVWDAATGREVACLADSKDHWFGAGFPTKDGKFLITREQGKDGGGVIRFRDATDFKVRRELATGQLYTPRLSPDGTLLAGYVQNHATNYSLEIWDVKEGKKLCSWQAHEGTIWHFDFSPDGKLLVSGGNDKAIRFWDARTGEKKYEITGHPNVVGKVAVSRDGKTLATLGMTEIRSEGGAYYPWDNLIRVWDISTGKELRQLKMPHRPSEVGGRPEGFSLVQFAPDGKTLVTGGADGILRFWDVSTGKELRRYPLGTKGVAQVAFSPDGKTIAIATQSIRLLDVATGRDVVKLEGHANGVHAVALTPEGRTVATAGDATVATWDVASGRETGRLKGLDAIVMSLRLLPGGKELLCLDLEKTLRVWDVATRAEVRRLPTKGLSYQLAVVSPDGKRALMHTEDAKTLVQFDLATGKEVSRVPNPARGVHGAAFLADSGHLVVWDGDHDVHVLDAKTGKSRNTYSFAEAPPMPRNKPGLVLPAAPLGGGTPRSGLSYGAAASPNGRLIAYGSQQGYLALHDVATGKAVHVVGDLSDGPCFFAFTPDGRMLAWAGWREPTIHLMEVATGKERHRLVGHKGRVTALTFSADGRTLVSGGEDTTALVWDVVGKAGAKGDVTTCWADLADADAAKAFRAMRRLLQSPAEATALLRKHVRPVPVVEAKHLKSLVADLDSDAFATREGATAELEKLGEAVAEACRAALAAGPSPEKRRRLERLLKPIDAEAESPSAERLRLSRSLEVLERIPTAQARAVLKALAGGAPGAWLTREAGEALARRGR